MKTDGVLVLSGLILAAVAGLAFAGEKPAKGDRPEHVAPHEAKASAFGAGSKAASDYPIIGYLEKRGRTITIKAGPKGALYSIKNAEGKTLFENLSADQLRARAPEIHQFITTSVAGGSSKRGAVFDASLRKSPDGPILFHGLDARR